MVGWYLGPKLHTFYGIRESLVRAAHVVAHMCCMLIDVLFAPAYLVVFVSCYRSKRLQNTFRDAFRKMYGCAASEVDPALRVIDMDPSPVNDPAVGTVDEITLAAAEDSLPKDHCPASVELIIFSGQRFFAAAKALALLA